MTAVQPAPAPSVPDVLSLQRGGPTVQRIMLGTRLRRLRESLNISRDTAASAIRASDAKLCRMELGRVGFKQRDIADLLTLYGVQDPDVRQEFLDSVRRANEPGWWRAYGDAFPSWFEQHLGMEEAASLIRTYEVQFIPGLLQTPAYAEAVIRLGHAIADPDAIQRRVDLRMTRQQLLAKPGSPKLWVVVDEAALRRPLGGSDVMRDQLKHLIEVAALPNVTLQVLPFHVGGHAAAGGPITVLRFPVPDLPDVVYLEQLSSALYLDKPEEVDHYLAVMDRLSLVASPAADSVTFLEQVLKQT
ncbi:MULTISPECIES: helix-turn-helix domain-containing protein [unclassified Streptomyces]|uniref:helix-turn-helix domain-containing protein n=1 Tax=unclassified Streptomyces TaxID=2593676 RepID=UPI00224D6D0C|nr:MULTISPECIES: helix-turn-helix transcriptional regulator [unclassified Streptomyces]MCX5054177.1 helix-turn-helix domain-containing protein [Streptomyces sp. NBC_00474]MCX5063109.1 helix-turn-helix domain-containing protein [Streptomyces sp. NBC_00452]